jgi:hypothetical protein
MGRMFGASSTRSKRRTHRKAITRAALFTALLCLAVSWSNLLGSDEGVPSSGHRRLLNATSPRPSLPDTCIALLDNDLDKEPAWAMTVYVILMLWVFQGVAGALHPASVPQPSH